MTYITKPKLHHPGLPKNKLGFTHRGFRGTHLDLVRRAAATIRSARR